jgi:uncharacterized coiled-coil DUF342 family protein
MTEIDYRAKVKSLIEIRDTIMVKSAPLRAERDRIVNEAREKAKALEAQIQEIEKDLYDVCQELGAAARHTGPSMKAESLR